MTKRRPLTAGVHTPETTDADAMRAFVTQERPKTEAPELAVVPEPAVEKQALPEPVPEEPKVEEPRRLKKRGKAKLPVGLIPVTVRLRPEIAAALKRASLERQLAGEEVHTQQDILEEALEPWLTNEGVL